MAKNKERKTSRSFGYSEVNSDYSFQMKKKPNLWWLLLLLLLLVGMLFLVKYCCNKGTSPSVNNPTPTPVTQPTPQPQPNPERQPDPEQQPNPDPNSEPIPVPHTGDVQILLKWKNYNDLDLSCVDPYGDTVWYQNKRVPSGGELDVDMNVSGGQSRSPIENIYWPTGGAPKGQYTVYVKYFAQNDLLKRKTSYEVMVKHGGTTETYTGTLSREKQVEKICTFTMD